MCCCGHKRSEVNSSVNTMSSNDAQAYKTHNWGVKWTEEEDIRLLQGIERFGDNDWRRVSEVVGTRDAGNFPESPHSLVEF